MFTVAPIGDNLNKPSAFVIKKDNEIRGIVHINPHDLMGQIFARKDADRMAERYNSGEMYDFF